MPESTIDPSARLRRRLAERRERATTTDLQRIPFMLNQGLADRQELLARQHDRLGDQLAHLLDLDAERDPDDPTRDVRASGEDLSDTARRIATVEAELERVMAELEAVTAEVREDSVTLVFRRVDAGEYEQALVRAGGAAVDEDANAASRFHDLLLAKAFVRIELAGGEDSGVTTWAEFAAEAALTFGELDPIRALVYAANRRGGNSVPFSSTPSRRTTTS